MKGRGKYGKEMGVGPRSCCLQEIERAVLETTKKKKGGILKKRGYRHANYEEWGETKYGQGLSVRLKLTLI